MRANIRFKNVSKTINDLKKYDEKRQKAATVALVTEMKRLKETLKKEIKSGSPGGDDFEKKKYISRVNKILRGRRYSPKPMIRFAGMVSFFYKKVGKKKAAGYIGFYDKNPLADLIQKHQSGHSIPVSKAMRRYFGRAGEELNVRSKKKFFQIRRSTTRFRVPARPIINPFWDANQTKAKSNIKKNFKAKMAGGIL